MKNQSKINKGMAEVCEMLAKYKEVTPKSKKQFLRYAEVFRKLGGDFHNQNKIKSKMEVLQMTKKLTESQKEEREIRKILLKIRALEKTFPQQLVERACVKYKNANLDKRKAEKEMKELEEKLEDAKRRLK